MNKPVKNQMSKQASSLISSQIITLIRAINSISQFDYEVDSPSSDELMNLCLARLGNPQCMFATHHVSKPISIWNFMSRGQEPQKDRGFKDLEDGFLTAVDTYRAYNVDPEEVCLVFKMGGLFGYAVSDGFCQHGVQMFPVFTTPKFDTEVMKYRGQVEPTGRIIFPIDNIFKTYELEMVE
jgi:hypothetical protein